jgi:hypothetical protein
VAKTPEIIGLHEERFIFAHSFRSFNSWLADSIAFRLVARQNVMVEGYGRGKLFTARQLGSKERGVWEGAKDNIYPWHTSSDSLPPTRPHLLVSTTFQYMPSIMNPSVN